MEKLKRNNRILLGLIILSFVIFMVGIFPVLYMEHSLDVQLFKEFI
jgi:hypothetical protein